MSYNTRTTCRCCGSSDLEELFSLGSQYVSDFISQEQAAYYEETRAKVPIVLDLCRSCTLVQARHSVDQQQLYGGNYWYRSGVTQTMGDALADVAKSITDRMDLQPNEVVLDIGANDGTLLNCFSDYLTRIACEPAENMRQYLSAKYDHYMNGFWSADFYRECTSKKAKVVTAIGMMYDMEDPNQFVADVAKVLAPDGLFVAQLMCLKQTMGMGDVGNFCHEHLEFYSLRSLIKLFNKHGLEVFDVEENNVNGGSYRIYSRLSTTVPNVSDPFVHLVDREVLTHLDRPNMLRAMFQEMVRERDKCVAFIREESKTKRIWVYGASTKGNVILQWYGLDADVIDRAADRDPNKIGKLMVGSNVKIESEDTFRRSAPEYALVLPYAFLPEMVEREREWLLGGGKFIVPIPEFKVVGKEVLG